MGTEVIKPDDILQGKCVDRENVFILNIYSMPGFVLNIGETAMKLK